MSGRLIVHRAGPSVTVQDLGRPGHQASGLSRGGAADRLALFEAAALFGHREAGAALEMAGYGGEFSLSADSRIALTGAPMRARIDGEAVRWNATHHLGAGQRLSVEAAEDGVYGYLSVAGGIQTQERLGSRSAHLTAGLGAALKAGDELPVGVDDDRSAPQVGLPVDSRFRGGTVRVMPGPQTALYPDDVLASFRAARFRRGQQANRQGVRLDHDGAPFALSGQLSIVSDLIVPGDIQMTGDGVPFVLLSECQTIGGYPRIGTVIPDDLPIVAQSQPGADLRFRFLTVDEADAAHRTEGGLLRDLRAKVQPLVRDPRDVPDLLSYQLVGGVTAGDDLER